MAAIAVPTESRDKWHGQELPETPSRKKLTEALNRTEEIFREKLSSGETLDALVPWYTTAFDQAVQTLPKISVHRKGKEGSCYQYVFGEDSQWVMDEIENDIAAMQAKQFERVRTPIPGCVAMYYDDKVKHWAKVVKVVDENKIYVRSQFGHFAPICFHEVSMVPLDYGNRVVYWIYKTEPLLN